VAGLGIAAPANGAASTRRHGARWLWRWSAVFGTTVLPKDAKVQGRRRAGDPWPQDAAARHSVCGGTAGRGSLLWHRRHPAKAINLRSNPHVVLTRW